MPEAWVTLATTDSYALGALVLAYSLRRVKTDKKIHCLITDQISQGLREALWKVFDDVSEVNVLDSGDEENLALIQRPDLGVTFTKLHCWRLLQYSKAVFLDADTLVLQNSDELFEREELSAAPDIGWPDMFNSGVFVFRPSLDTYRALLQHAREVGSFDGGDQGLLNSFFSDWREKDVSFRLSFTYNMTATSVYTYIAAQKRFAKDIKIVHFLGSVKPWQSVSTEGSGYQQIHLSTWWAIFRACAKPALGDDLTGQVISVSEIGTPLQISRNLFVTTSKRKIIISVRVFIVV